MSAAVSTSIANFRAISSLNTERTYCRQYGSFGFKDTSLQVGLWEVKGIASCGSASAVSMRFARANVGSRADPSTVRLRRFAQDDAFSLADSWGEWDVRRLSFAQMARSCDETA